MIWAEFHQRSTGWNGTDYSGPVRIIPACGSDSVAVLDGRLGPVRRAHCAREVCRKRGYLGFSILSGDGFNRPSRTMRALEVL